MKDFKEQMIKEIDGTFDKSQFTSDYIFEFRNYREAVVGDFVKEYLLRNAKGILDTEEQIEIDVYELNDDYLYWKEELTDVGAAVADMPVFLETYRS